ncbi:hypothetical protein EIP91_002695 [Steccherinum ochraceum]|uniref:Uncharacterized protein n=1 Tax=Steccherinum ochraceum TaxID=92696 RepID=A0A4R0RK87_9APHY|nr:hypothetical protein EIP91_002695 [Steccherinum ochraceum]
MCCEDLRRLAERAQKDVAGRSQTPLTVFKSTSISDSLYYLVLRLSHTIRTLQRLPFLSKMDNILRRDLTVEILSPKVHQPVSMKGEPVSSTHDIVDLTMRAVESEASWRGQKLDLSLARDYLQSAFDPQPVGEEARSLHPEQALLYHLHYTLHPTDLVAEQARSTFIATSHPLCPRCVFFFQGYLHLFVHDLPRLNICMLREMENDRSETCLWPTCDDLEYFPAAELKHCISTSMVLFLLAYLSDLQAETV